MTFIASVIAKDGVAIVADSFVTTLDQSIDRDSFLDYLSKTKNKKSIPIEDIVDLFNKRPSHTRNFADKLFQFDQFSAISTAGSAYINGKEIKDIVKSIAIDIQADEGVYYARDIEDILKDLCSKVRVEVFEHLKNNDFGETDFVFSHFNRGKNKPQVFVIRMRASSKDNYDVADDTIVSYSEKSHLKIITDGQDGFVDRLIFGSLYTNIIDVKDFFIEYIIKKCKPKSTKKAEIISEIEDMSFLENIIKNDVFYIKFRELSLQEAVDLASLLIKIIMDIQVYTEKIPTVGGLIRLAIINKETGFQWISGDKIVPSKII
ncbi:hypothetical protein IRZ71_05585 [Flavobacterium sp. ANB]|uniref:hypothetical protein n=1 Tax=unclassified Flavobacterium TaxID=196869 RepID=UPI0012B8A087|nr:MULTISPECIES: hypothetical protein [unclassified Flavobacterium]MBF4515802.1 hypothetical protein [Flavobacterium sp. ANB]MTD68805.1 hypothetical protein [Flavobacterium sp. LC2016-13]